MLTYADVCGLSHIHRARLEMRALEGEGHEKARVQGGRFTLGQAAYADVS